MNLTATNLSVNEWLGMNCCFVLHGTSLINSDLLTVYLLSFLLILNTGVEVCTGPLGQGISNAVGLAIAERHLAAEFNTDDHAIFDHHTYVITGDGCLQEGVASEACSLAGHLGLGRLIVLYDDNQITIDGSTDLSFTEDVSKRFESYGWHVQYVPDVTGSLDDLRKAIETAKGVADKPSLIRVKTAIGYGSPSKQGLAKAHGAPLGAEDLKGAKKFYGLPEDKAFYVPPEVKKSYQEAAAVGEGLRKKWEVLFADYTKKNPEKAAEISRRFSGSLPEGLLDKLPSYTAGKDKDLATRKYSQLCLTAVGPEMPELMGGSADLTPSNLTNYEDLVDFQKDTPEGRYLRFGVREHGMVAICNGIFAHGGLRPYCATFLVFTGYALGAIRLSALSNFGVLFIMTHDSIGLGEDGPTHQPVETLESLRSIPNINVCRPADGNETAAAYELALLSKTTPTVICCSRSTVPGIAGSCKEKALKGAYVAVETAETPALFLIGTGSEVGICVAAAQALSAKGIPTRVVSMMCQEVFLAQDEAYQTSVLPGNIPTLSVEASAIHGWHRFSHAQIGLTGFGRSGPGKDVFKFFGFTAENVEKKGEELVTFYANRNVPNLNDRPFLSVVPQDH